MRVLVSAATRHGATADIAGAIAGSLTSAGVEAVVAAPDAVRSLDGFDAAVIGSAVYVGHWLEPAKALIERHRAALGALPVWLFSSGPIGEPPKPVEEPVDVASLASAVGARGHRVFPGLVDRKRLGFGEKAIMAAVHAKEGDYRPWAEIDGWAREIAAALRGDATPA